MIWFANDYFTPVGVSLFLLAFWFWAKDPAQRALNHRTFVITAISIGAASGFLLVANHLWRHPHPFVDMPELLETVYLIYYPIHDPPFPSNTSAVSFAVATAVWLSHRKLGYILLIPATLWPFAKLYAAVYYPSDFLGGAVLGILSALFIAYFFVPLFDPIINRVFVVLRRLVLA